MYSIRPLHGPPFAGRASFASRKASNWLPNMLQCLVLYRMHSSQSVQQMHHLQGHWFWKERIETLGNTSIQIMFRLRLSSKWRIRAMGELTDTLSFWEALNMTILSISVSKWEFKWHWQICVYFDQYQIKGEYYTNLPSIHKQNNLHHSLNLHHETSVKSPWVIFMLNLESACPKL